MITEIIIFSLIYIIIRSYLWYRRRLRILKTFSKNGIKGPKPSLISGNFYHFKDNPNDSLDEWIEQYGDVFGYFIGDRPTLVISDLDTIKEIFIKNSKLFRDRPKFALKVKPFITSLLGLRGDRWRHVRRVMTPPLAHHKIYSEEIMKTMCESIDIFIKNLEKQKESVVRVEDRMQSISLDIVCKVVLNMYDTDVHQENSHLKNSLKMFMEQATNIVLVCGMFFPFIASVVVFLNNYLSHGRLIDSIVRHLNKQIQIESQIFNRNSVEIKSNNVLKSLMKCYLENQLERDELTGNALLLLIGGYDTTSNGLTSALYCLAKNQEIQERLRNEVISYGYQSPYLDMIWSETLRLFPPVALTMQREAAQDVIINDIKIDKGTFVQVPIWHVQHDPKIWPKPYEFNPQRFESQNRKDRHSAAFVTFGLGPRACIGVELATLEGKLTLSKIVEKFRIETCEQTPESLQFKCPTEILYPKNPIYLRFVSINKI